MLAHLSHSHPHPYSGHSLTLFVDDGGSSQGILREDGGLCSWEGLDRVVGDGHSRFLRERVSWTTKLGP